MAVVTAVSDRLIALEQGEVTASGPPAAVLADPRVVASYLGNSDAVIARSTVDLGDAVPSP